MYKKVFIGSEVSIHESSQESLNYVNIGDHVKIAKRCSVYGSSQYIVNIGDYTYIGMGSILNGYNAPLIIGSHVSIAQYVNIMVDSGPNASEKMQRVFPVIRGAVEIGDHSWIGSSSIIMPKVKIGAYCVVGAGSFVNTSFEDFSIIGGTPAKLIRKFTSEERRYLLSD